MTAPSVRVDYGAGDISGPVNAVAYDPFVVGTYWVGAAHGGLWKSTDSGTAWTFLSGQWQSQQTSSIAINPVNPNVVYVGTGDFPGGGTGGFGIMKTVDGGTTWNVVGQAQFGTYSVSKVWLTRNAQHRLRRHRPRLGSGRPTDAGPGMALYRQREHLVTRDPRPCGLDGPGIQRAYGYQRPLLLRGGRRRGRADLALRRPGATWSPLPAPFNGVNQVTGVDIAASPTDPLSLYAVSGTDMKVYQSGDNGQTWKDITTGFPSDGPTTGDNLDWSQAGSDAALTVSTRQDTTGTPRDVLYVGLLDLANTPDSGTTWRSIGSTFTNNAELHNGQHSLAVNPSNPNELLAGNDGGVYLVSSNPGSTTVNVKSLNDLLGVADSIPRTFTPRTRRRRAACGRTPRAWLPAIS